MGFLLSNYQLTICILYSLIFCLSSSAHLCHNDESTALLQFKQLFSFNCSACGCYRTSGLHNTDNWKEGTDCCAWDGVTCDNTTSHVIGLDLGCNCLYGTIHTNSSLFNLVHLQYLDLSTNNFNQSQILPSFGRFTNLTHLRLFYSHLSGPIQSPEEEVWQGNNFSNSIFYLQKLQELWLGDNEELTGKLPSFINRTLRHLRTLDLAGTGFTGELPNSIGQLEYLEDLYLRYSNFSGNGLTGLIPAFLGDLTKLESLDLSQNKFSGEIPQQLTKLTFLEVLNFSQNNLTGLIPRGGQFETFSNTSYEGNLGLCGFPLSNNCGNVQIAESPTLPSSFSHKFKFKFDGFGWEAVLMGFGCGVLLGLLIGSCIIRRKEERLLRIFGVKMGQHGNQRRFGRR